MTKIFGQEDDIVTDIEAVQAEVDNLDGDAMRGTDSALLASNYATEKGTDNASLASVWTSALASALANYTAVRAGYLDELDFDLAAAIAAIPTTMRGTDLALLATNYVTERGTDGAALSSFTGNYINGGAVTAILAVSPNGDGSDGLSWTTAYQTIQAALDVASTDGDDMTLILVSPHPTYYDINTTGDPTWTANVLLTGTHPHFAIIKNDHASATSVLKLTGKSAVENLLFDLGTGNNGLIMTSTGAGGRKIHIDGANLTSAKTGLWLDGASAEHADLSKIDIVGNTTYLTGLKVDQFARCNIDTITIVSCLTCLQIVGADSNENIFHELVIGDSALGIDIDAGNEQHFDDVTFHHNTRNVDDEVGDSIWIDMFGALDIAILPDNLTGIQVDTGAANTYGSDTELLSAVSRDNPFRIVGVIVDTSSTEWYQFRLSDDSGSTFFDILQFDADKKAGTSAPSGTEHIFNKGTRISASVRDVSGGDNVKVWLKIQKI